MKADIDLAQRWNNFPLSPGDLSRLGSGKRNLGEARGPRGPSERERASHWAGVRASVNINQPDNGNFPQP
jgi:hypothetical protein